MSIEIKVPELGESVVEDTVARWMKQVGDAVKTGESLVELETDKVNLEVAAERGGVLASIAHPAGADVKIGDVLGTLEEAGSATASDKPQQKAESDDPVPPAATAAASEERATPVAKRVAAEQGVVLTEVPGGGPGGRVMKQDVENFVRNQPATVPPVSQPAPQAIMPPLVVPPLPISSPERAADARGETRERMSRRRRTIAERLVMAQQTAAMLTTFNEIDMSAVMDLRKRRNDAYEKRHGIKLGFMSFFTKAVIGALKAFPQLNAEIQESDIVFKHYYDIGIAVGAEEGLVVPVLRDTDKMSFATIEKSIKELANKARAGTLAIDDLRGGTFTITNGGIFGSLLSTPILNPPQVGILGLHKIEDRPIALNGQVVIRPMMYVALSYDHRLVDGREAVQFLVKVKELIEDPETLLLEG